METISFRPLIVGWVLVALAFYIVLFSHFTNLFFDITQELFDMIRLFYAAFPAYLFLILGTLIAARQLNPIYKISILLNVCVLLLIISGYVFNTPEMHIVLGLTMFVELFLMGSITFIFILQKVRG